MSSTDSLLSQLVTSSSPKASTFTSPLISNKVTSQANDSRAPSSLFSLMAFSFFKLRSIPFKQKSHVLIRARGRYQSAAITRRALWRLTFSCDYSRDCKLSWKPLEFCQLKMFFLLSVTLLSFSKPEYYL